MHSPLYHIHKTNKLSVIQAILGLLLTVANLVLDQAYINQVFLLRLVGMVKNWFSLSPGPHNGQSVRCNHGMITNIISFLMALWWKDQALKIRGVEWSTENDVSQKMSDESQNIGIWNWSLGISDSLPIEPFQSLKI